MWQTDGQGCYNISVMTWKSMAWCWKVHHNVKKYVMIFKKLRHDVKKNMSSMSWCWKVYHYIKKYVVSKSTSWCQKVCQAVEKYVVSSNTQKVRHYKSIMLQKLVITSKCMESTSWCQKVHHDFKTYAITSKMMSWCQICHNVKMYFNIHHVMKSKVWTSKLCFTVKKSVIMSKWMS